MRIMIVEDDRALRRIYTHILEDHELTIHSHADDLFNVKLWRDIEATIVDMVLKIGNASGLDLLRWLHEFDLGGKKIITTGWVQLDREVLNLLSDQVLIKPFDLDDLHKALEGSRDE